MLSASKLDDKINICFDYRKVDTSNILARYLFGSFVWSIAKCVNRSELARGVTCKAQDGFNVYDSNTWNAVKIESPKLNALLWEFHGIGMGSFEGISQLIVPALSYAEKLPSECVVELIRRKIRDSETNRRWKECFEVYNNLAGFASRGVSKHFRFKAIAAVVDFVLGAEDAGTEQDALEEPIKKIMSVLKHPEREREIAKIGELFGLQQRREEYKSLFERFGVDTPINNAQSILKNQELFSLFALTPCHMAVLTPTTDFTARLLAQETQCWRTSGMNGDVLGWTPLHYAASAFHDPELYRVISKMLNTSTGNEPRDIAGRTPLHYAARYGHLDVVRVLCKYADINARGRREMLPIHWAAKRG